MKFISELRTENIARVIYEPRREKSGGSKSSTRKEHGTRLPRENGRSVDLRFGSPATRCGKERVWDKSRSRRPSRPTARESRIRGRPNRRASCLLRGSPHPTQYARIAKAHTRR